jgi:hypothetical protein
MEKMVHYLEFERPIRLGLWITDAIGPFDTAQEARNYYDNEITKWAIVPETVACRVMVTPNVAV